MSDDQKKKFIKDFMKQCKKKKFKGSSLVPGKLKSWGCKKAANKAWKKFKENGPAPKKKIAGITLFEIGDDIKLKF